MEQTHDAERALAEAEAANRAKSDFLATMSHEIRTPINAIMGYTDLLQLGLAGPLLPQQQEHLERVIVSSRHLLRLIEDVLDLAKVEAGRVTMHQETAAVVNAVAGAVELVAPQAETRSLTLRSRSVDDGDDTTYVGDEHRVRQILVNLLTNAVKFTEPGGTIEVTYGSTPREDAPRATADPGWAWVSVRDTGPGVEPHDQERIFRPFEQAESGRTRTHGGAGLGLAISRDLAHLMGGDITLVSEPGSGAEFTLWLPRTPVPAATPAAGAQAPLELRTIGLTLLREIDTVADAYVKRLRMEMPERVAGLEDAQLRDHLPTWVAEMAQVLMDLGAGTSHSIQLRDGVEIRRVMADLHGSQRAELGWTEDAMRREMTILAEEIERVTHVRDADSRAAEAARLITSRLIEEASVISLRALARR
ncbi:MAG TPA: HAMP domain-containing sensor histidine kinase [Longimicrobiales bacterium]|nr:HAMP domain-containing sensor histidine kinase [Longimicrobiales bacterium]